MRSYGFALFLLMSVNCRAENHPFNIQCPTEYPARLVNASNLSGWVSTIQDNFPLHAAGAMEGPVRERGFLKPVLHESKDKYEEIYDLRHSSSKWLWCGYGADNNLTLSKRLPDAVTHCVVTYRRTIPEIKNYFEVKQIACK